jgi:putative transposase
MKEVYLLCNLSRQAHQQAMGRLVRQQEKEVAYVGLMTETRDIHPGMGLRTMYEMLLPEGIGRDAFVALGLQEGFRLKALEKYVRTTYSVKSNRFRNLLGGKQFTDVNQLWSSDITYLYCLDRFYYIVMIMDVYSRRIIGYSIADNMRAENTLDALKMALALRGIARYQDGLIHHSDRGSQYVSDIYTDTLYDHGIQISMCNEVYENTHIERLNDTIKNQYLNRRAIASEQQLKQEVNKTMETYNSKRPHQSLGGMNPVAFEAYLKTVPMEERIKMEIYTSSQLENPIDPSQLNLMFN